MCLKLIQKKTTHTHTHTYTHTPKYIQPLIPRLSHQGLIPLFWNGALFYPVFWGGDGAAVGDTEVLRAYLWQICLVHLPSQDPNPFHHQTDTTAGMRWVGFDEDCGMCMFIIFKSMSAVGWHYHPLQHVQSKKVGAGLVRRLRSVVCVCSSYSRSMSATGWHFHPLQNVQSKKVGVKNWLRGNLECRMHIMLNKHHIKEWCLRPDHTS
jgi:hypothetical protein